ncbi:LacI family DNA-binding transcriptional regulator [Pseudohalocynthiibacter sp. F2068]|jgi:LacI family transcriptional regulator, galactose operon repressor|uniref:LacI family DNA-binding transcriptional regulator n=1 Tax=Pseudohalocynthiibacter sp. F2068 TaxID=2926418 RepID=UPI001FF4F2BF|nr:LacI family DNA-binding transcriptional regulator [Pseudohalocynthiibacter sp. F2068]MCK0104433.1 LacI family transcriptional regulator [Pseudohalocynthiibacter sp. F2068]
MAEKKRRATTITDVAKAAGVSLGSVSRVLSGDKTFVVREETRKKIIKTAQSLNFKPNPLGRGLRTSRTFTLGAVIPHLDNPVHAQILKGAERAAAKRGYSLLIAHRSEGITDSSLYERLLQHTRVDGLIVATMHDEQAGVATLAELGHPFVLVNRKAIGVRHFVVCEDRGGSRKAVEYLASKGHRIIGHLAGQLHRYNAECRMNGYKDGLNACGLKFDPRLVVEGGYSQNEGADAMLKMLKSGNPRPTAVFVNSLLAAAGAMSTLRKAGLVIPDDISIIAFNDGAIAEVLAPPLTTIRVPLEQMGQIASDTLIDAIEGNDVAVAMTISETIIVERESVASIG